MKRSHTMLAAVTASLMGLTSLPVQAEESDGIYVLMNIPYSAFYAGEGIQGIDAVSSATQQKTRSDLAAGSYHTDPNGTDISGVIYPVKVDSLEELSGKKQITDSDSVSITTTLKGNTETKEYTGKDALFEEPDYSYYVLNEKPSHYKTLSVNSDGSYSFSQAEGTVQTVQGVTGSVKYNTRHKDVEVQLNGTDISNTTKVSGVILTDSDGNEYALRHLENLFRGTEIGWNNADMNLNGRRIKNIRYITSDSIIDYPVNILIGSGYVLMNIPYRDFYGSAVDAVSSATLMKPRTADLAGGSYHTDPNGTDISGVTYPVYVSDFNQLASCTQVTDSDSRTITVTNRGQTNTAVYNGKDALFESPDYAFYLLPDGETPAYYKTLTVNEEGKPVFSDISGEVKKVEGVTGRVTVGGRHKDYEVALSNTEGIDAGTRVSGIILTDTEGNTYDLRHIANIWRGTEIGWNNTDISLSGKTIANIRYITQESIIDYPVSIYIPVNTELKATVRNALVSDGKTSVGLNGKLPDDFRAEYSVKGLKDAAISGSELHFSRSASVGNYTLVISDQNGKYADIKADFTVYTDQIPAVMGGTSEDPQLVRKDRASEKSYKDYLKKITSVTTGDRTYSAKEVRRTPGIVIIDPETGKVNLQVKDQDGNAIFDGSGKYTLKVTAEGYTDTEFRIPEKEVSNNTGSGQNDRPASADTTQNPQQKKADASPDTGDQNHTGLWAGTMLCAAVVSVWMIRRRRA